MAGYYSENLSAERLKRVYEVATPRVRRYLRAEVDHVLERISPGDSVLELGCGYGRILPALAGRANRVVGIDTSLASLRLARQTLEKVPNSDLVCTDAAQLGFSDDTFDCVACIQNGISAFHVDQRQLIREAVRVTRPGGLVLFSTYSEKFWEHRLEWFRLQAEEGLLGEIDWDRTGNGVIVCRDGFTATTVSKRQFYSLLTGLNVHTRIVEVDNSSLFCESIPE